MLGLTVARSDDIICKYSARGDRCGGGGRNSRAQPGQVSPHAPGVRRGGEVRVPDAGPEAGERVEEVEGRDCCFLLCGDDQSVSREEEGGRQSVGRAVTTG